MHPGIGRDVEKPPPASAPPLDQVGHRLQHQLIQRDDAPAPFRFIRGELAQLGPQVVTYPHRQAVGRFIRPLRRSPAPPGAQGRPRKALAGLDRISTHGRA